MRTPRVWVRSIGWVPVTDKNLALAMEESDILTVKEEMTVEEILKRWPEAKIPGQPGCAPSCTSDGMAQRRL